jgi:HSP20 family protein
MSKDKDDVFNQIREMIDTLDEQYGENELFDELDDVFEKLSESQGSPFTKGDNPFSTGEDSPFFGRQTDESNDSSNVGITKTVEHEDYFELVADLPGYSEEDVSLTVSDDERVRIEAEATEDMYRESISHVYNLSEPVEPAEAEADLNNGVLTVTLPKQDPDDQTTISID